MIPFNRFANRGLLNNRASPIGHPSPPAPPFRSRQTLAEHVRDNMVLANRLGHLHRIGVVAKNTGSNTRMDIKELLETTFRKINGKGKSTELISGIVVLYETHTIMVLTGTERYFGLMAEKLRHLVSEYFGVARVVFVHCNANQVNILYSDYFYLITLRFIAKQRFTEGILFRNCDTQHMVAPSSITRGDLENTQQMVEILMFVCKIISQNEENLKHFKAEEEPVNFLRMLPTVSLIDNVLKIDQLMTLDYFFSIFELTLSYEHYDEIVWPIPNDFTPDHVYDNGKYDINLSLVDKNASES